jgi:hypothetical protein
MDKSLAQLLDLWSLYKNETAFPVSSEFALSPDGRRWFTQVNDEPALYKFTDIALQHIKN